MIHRICKYGEPVLTKKNQKVDFKAIKNKLPAILKDMWDTLSGVGGLGLAANQIGLNMRIAVIKMKDEDGEGEKIVLINPEIIAKSGKAYAEEGCLSFPGFFVRIKRYGKVKVKALNEKGMPVEMSAEGLLARAFQHEIDHLDGILFTDKARDIIRN